VGAVTSSDEYRHPAYPYQRAPYKYSNVTYRQNTGLIDPFTPERGAVTLRGRIGRFVRNAAYIVPSLGGAVTAQRGSGSSRFARSTGVPVATSCRSGWPWCR